MKAIKRFQLVDVIVTADSGVSRITIGDQANLRTDSDQDIVIVGLEAYNINAIPLSSVSNNPLPTPAQLANAFLTLYVGTEESIDGIPLPELNSLRSALATDTSFFMEERTDFQNLFPVQWDKCFLQLGKPYNTGGANAEFSFLIGVHYLKYPAGTWKKQLAGGSQ